MTEKVSVCYFSPTQSTKKVVQAVSEGVAGKAGIASDFDLTLSCARKGWAEGLGALGAEDVLVVGFPVYAGRVPGVFLQEMKHLQGGDTPAVIVATYGNRAVDDSLLEAADVLVGQGFRIIGLVTFPCEHSFTSTVAPGRPDAADIEEARKLGGQIAEKLGSGSAAMVEVPGNKPYIEYPHADWRPLVDKDACTNCLECADVCPVDAIPDDPSITDECCIVCHACVKACSAGARTINTAALSPVIGMLEGNFTARQEALLVV